MTEDAEYVWKITWQEYKTESRLFVDHVKAFTNKREALIFACELEDDSKTSNVVVTKWFGD